MKSKKVVVLVAIGILLITSSVGIFSYANVSFFKPKQQVLLVYAKGSAFVEDWKKVDSLEQHGLSKSALDEVEKILAKSRTQNNHQQIVKALIIKAKFQSYLEENAFKLTLSEIEKEAEGATYPLKPMLHSVIAELYWQYYQNNRWKFYNRTTTVGFAQDDIETWDITKIIERTIHHYLLSIKDIDELKRTPVNTFEDVIIKKDSSEKFRPFLYDFLSHRALSFFMNEEPNVIKPVYAFVLNNVNYFSEAEDFTKVNIESKDSLSLKYYALKTLQNLTKTHVVDGNIDALVDVELTRLKFVNNNSILAKSDSLYYDALIELQEKYSKHDISTEVAYVIAQIHNQKGINYTTSKNAENKLEVKKAYDVCVNAIGAFPNSLGAKKCAYLINQIQLKSIQVTTEKVNTPNKPALALLSYKNVSKVYARLIKISYDDYKEHYRMPRDEDFLKKLKAQKTVSEWEINLEKDEDYQNHSVEFKIPAQDMGYYVLLVASNKNFESINEAVTYTPFWFSNLGYTTRRTENQSIEFFVADRENGTPLKDVVADVFYDKYNYITRKYEQKRMATKTTNEDGYFNIEPSNDYRNYYVDFSYQKDRLNTDDSYYQYRNYREQKQTQVRTIFFTDRAIYRPGQTIYFKGLVIDTDGDKNNIKTNYTTTVTFNDANYQKVSDVKLTTNEYGTFSGSFVAPQGGLNGQMHIATTSGNKYFSVEEYKRPTFEAEFKPIKGSYKLNQNIKAVGKATTYSGAALDGAEVNYRVVRNASFPYWCYYRWGYHPQSPQMEITNGTTTTKNDGSFDIDFKAIPDETVNQNFEPTYSYTIYADVVDINGETQSTTTYVYVSNKALLINISIPELVNKNAADSFYLSTTNLNGEVEFAKGNIKVWQLKKTNQVFRSKLWAKADKHLMTKEEYQKDFPFDEYKDENNKFNWEKSTKVFDVNFNTEHQKIIRFGKLPECNSGYYVLEATSVDVFGNEVKEIKYFTLFGENEKSFPLNDISFFTKLKNVVEPGEKASYLVGSAAKNATVLYEIEHKGKIVSRNWIKLSGSQQKIEIPITEEHRGNFVVHFSFVKHGRNFNFTDAVYVPYTNKMLDVKFETFRNKLLPGQNEEWKIKISDKKGDKVAAEMLATMYDASLDAFRPNYFLLDILNYYYSTIYWQGNNSFAPMSSSMISENWNKLINFPYQEYDQLNWFGYYFSRNYRYGYLAKNSAGRGLENDFDGVLEESSGDKFAEFAEAEIAMDATTVATGASVSQQSVTKSTGKLAANREQSNLKDEEQKDARDNNFGEVKARSNFNETAFFYPHLTTNEAGEIIISFTIPESLTKWKFMGLAHTKDLKSGMLTEEIITQKELMVYPNAPRFFREGDKMTFSTKIVNLSDTTIENGAARIFFYDALTMKDVTAFILKDNAENPFKVEKAKSTMVEWEIAIPEGYSAITYKVVAKSGDFSDGEEKVLPVLTNRMLVTESMPLPIRGNQSKTFTFEKLVNNKSTTLKHDKLTLEFTSNPAWYAVQALPYLIEYPYECAEQTFSRFYANSIASHVANSNPKIKNVFDSWKSSSPESFLSNLEKNQELKSAILEETPWVLNAQNESERKKRVGLLFDLNKMANEQQRALKKLQELQVGNGGWTWFKGMPESRYITQYIVTGLGRLKHMGVSDIKNDNKTWSMTLAAVQYLDNRIKEDYDYLKKYKVDLDKNNISQDQIMYLYARSYFINDLEISTRNKEAYQYYFNQAKKYWLSNSRYMQGMIAVAMNRSKENTTATKIVASLKENAINHDELGMYWKENTGGYYWYQAPIETQALLIEAFDEVTNDQKSVEAMKVWLLKQKQTQDWRTTKATTDACYALLMKGSDWLVTENNVEIKVGNQLIDPKKIADTKVEAGTGYFKTSWNKKEITPEMGTVKITKKDEGVSWGAMYWQYFEQLDKITSHETPLKIVKKVFLQENSASGPIIKPVTDKTKLKPGDKLKVRIELRVDRNMEYVHMKDMRAAGFEPINVFSGYRYQGGLGYFETTKDASTNFFFDYLPKGTYVFEYPLKVNMKGDFSNGITTIQCMYAPEFTSHSEGIRIKVE
ncbi:MAG: hypothetical protein H6589_09395 [Flavobacteriales bacterium]|nr:hypothetical protein [Flavobacteriales bacterium]